MTNELPLTKTMASVLYEIEHRGGRIERKPGGYWVEAGIEWTGVWKWYAGTSTIQALVSRKKLEYTEWQEGRRGKFPIAAKLVTP